jgi:hypothetical protein
MSKHAPTGSGRITTSKAVPPGGVRAVLSNYDIDVDTPKPEHLVFLNSRVVPVLLGRRARIWLQGSASRTGTAAHNMALSERRAENVAKHLSSRGVPTSQMQIDWVGEGLATTGIPENADDRAVSLLAAPLIEPPKPTPLPPTPTPSTTPTNTAFKISLLGGLSGGEALAVDQLFFQIWDEKNRIASIYVFSGLGKGAGALPLSVTLKGPWNDFRTTGPVAVNEFGGAARFTTGGVAWFTLNYLNMMAMPRGTRTNPNPLSLSTGFTVGAGGSTTVGTMILQFTGPFTGP